MSSLPEKDLFFEISEHPKAPLFVLENQKNRQKMISQMLTEKESNKNTREILRQIGFVNLWFFLKFICGYNGPFNKINSGLHLEMANFYQKYSVKGSKVAGFLGRKHYKSTVWTIGGSLIWRLLRNPDERILLFSAVTERSRKFMHTAQRVFDSNPFFADLYPEYVPQPNQRRWNETEMVIPCRTRNYIEPSVNPAGVCCSTQGMHGSGIVVDDPVGDAQLNSERESSAEMLRISNWVKSNLRTLPDDKHVWTFYTGTRYATDDAHTFIFESIKEKHGYWKGMEEIPESPKNEWIVYNRKTEEDGMITFPENISRDELENMKEEDPWTYWTQMQNSPEESGLTEFTQYRPKKFSMTFIDNEPVIRYYSGSDEVLIKLSDCDSVQACDPAASEKRMSAKTSRTAVGVISHAPNDERFLWNLHVDFVSPSQMMEWVFSDKKRFKDYIRTFVLETQGAFKLLKSDFINEQNRRNRAVSSPDETVYLNLQDIPKTGEKESMIRATLQPLLERGLFYVEEQSFDKFMAEMRVFPMNRSKMDILDMTTLGLRKTYKPADEAELVQRKRREDWFMNRKLHGAGICGY